MGSSHRLAFGGRERMDTPGQAKVGEGWRLAPCQIDRMVDTRKCCGSDRNPPYPVQHRAGVLWVGTLPRSHTLSPGSWSPHRVF